MPIVNLLKRTIRNSKANIGLLKLLKHSSSGPGGRIKPSFLYLLNTFSASVIANNVYHLKSHA